MGEAFIKWLEEKSDEKPFFATLWTMQTHYPYFTSGKEVDYKVDNIYLNKYLNALHHSDKVLGNILEELKKRGLSESTLVVVVGDHGEAFGRHGQYGHAVHLYEENIRIPLIFINPILFKGENAPVIGGLVDIAPTIMGLLDLPVLKEWQGINFFDPKRVNRAYFYTPWTNYLFGYRTEKYKYIYDASQNKSMVFDLEKDPQESNNIADDMPEFVELSNKRLARWIQHHSVILKDRIK